MAKIETKVPPVRVQARGQVIRAGDTAAAEIPNSKSQIPNVDFGLLAEREASLSKQVRDLRDTRPANDPELLAARLAHSQASLALGLLRKLRSAGVTAAELQALAAIAPTLGGKPV